MTAIRFSRSLVVALVAWTLAGCYVPVTNAVPHGGSTAGQGKIKVTGMIEYPVIDHLGTAARPPDASAPNTYPSSNAPYANVQATYGATHDFDIDVALEGEIQLIIPVPHGAFLGFRYVPYRGPNLHIGVGARFGYTGFGASLPSEPFEGATIRAYYGAASVGATMVTWDHVQPVFGLSVQPLRVQATIPDSAVQPAPIQGLNAAATLGLQVYWVTPFVTAGVFTSDNVRGRSHYFTFGLARSLY